MSKKKLAIIGAGPSGLVTLKYALDELADWEIHCYEKSANWKGAWGETWKGFVSTSTKYTTQFACHAVYDCSVSEEGKQAYREFFCDNEYGEYLDSFVEKFDLAKNISLNTEVLYVRKVSEVNDSTSQWELGIREGTHLSTRDERYDHVVICTGLTQNNKLYQQGTETSFSRQELEGIEGKTLVVVGGGESAVDLAEQLAIPAKNNKVYLSLRSGIRVSPRYHPIRGVPSDFLRNRLLLSIHRDLRNAIGQKFVEARICFQEIFEKVFPAKISADQKDKLLATRRKHWDLKLTKSAKDELFNMFHNKSDTFLDSVAEGRIEIIGPKAGDVEDSYSNFDGDDTISLTPDLVISSIGYQSGLKKLLEGKFVLSDFYLGCVHVKEESLNLVGFIRPIIGNIPSISEVQARYVIGLISCAYTRPSELAQAQRNELEEVKKRYAKIDTTEVYPVEMFPYCDRLSRLMASYPSLLRLVSFRLWLKVYLCPASTLHYDEDFSARHISVQRIYAPIRLCLLLGIIYLFDRGYRVLRGGWERVRRLSTWNRSELASNNTETIVRKG